MAAAPPFSPDCAGRQRRTGTGTTRAAQEGLESAYVFSGAGSADVRQLLSWYATTGHDARGPDHPPLWGGRMLHCNDVAGGRRRITRTGGRTMKRLIGLAAA